ncbi:hypothetical protein [Plantactinospora sp. CA-290183]|uniref:hypothetical protein n=1 Tax=Plantactinospora sp. CA-290183 TaxID=3240006 RepID=UPI003D8B63D7
MSGPPAARRGSDRRAGGWEAVALRGLEYVAYPALAGIAFCLLCVGVVTWLPALAAVGNALQRWRVENATRPFVGVLTAFPGYWRALWRHAVVSTAVLAVLTVNGIFLAGQPEPVAIPLLAVQLGILAAFAPYHLALAVVAGRVPDGGLRLWRGAALLLAFGSARRGLTLLAAAVLIPILTLPLALGPFLLGTTLPVLAGLALADHATGTAAPRR